MTIEYLRWFALQAAKQNFTSCHWAIYGCLLADCAVASSNVLYTTKATLAARLHLGRQTVAQVISDLSKSNLLSTDASGRIELIQPDPRWLNKVNAESQPNHSQISLNVSRAQKVAGAGKDTPPKGVSTSQGQRPNPDLPPPPKNQAKALNARQQLELYQRIGWIVPIDLKRAAEETPDEVWERKEVNLIDHAKDKNEIYGGIPM